MHLYKVLYKKDELSFELKNKFVIADDYFAVLDKHPIHNGITLIQKDIEVIKRTTDQ